MFSVELKQKGLLIISKKFGDLKEAQEYAKELHIKFKKSCYDWEVNIIKTK
ncbi:hypothetical protein [uncultured Cetobacterium sp.]|uniref:hypothetical protein n=1 Tax=uncultured Cetobacterium sp. TaxID=527638 RepID=UPI00263A1DED|nr:hypothetical protein [uncultured Cetobacterium sp.]